jgi:hypothetical protein
MHHAGEEVSHAANMYCWLTHKYAFIVFS